MDNNRSIYTDEELVSLILTRDEPAFNYLYARYAGFLYHIVLRIIKDNHLAKEILQEAFVKIWRNIGSYDGSKSKLFTWMLQVTRNAALDAVKSKAYQNSLRNCAIDHNIPIEVSNGAFPVSTDFIGVKEKLGKLPPKYRVLLELAYLQGYTYQGIAKRERLPLGTVKTRIRKGLLQLRAFLD
jgi:RNA polymerase sigma-70 factor (ECF subfamily)